MSKRKNSKNEDDGKKPVENRSHRMPTDVLLLMREIVARAVECGGQRANKQDAKDLKRLIAQSSDRRSGGWRRDDPELAKIVRATPEDLDAHQLRDQ